MAAGLGFKDFQTGDVLTAADVDGYLMQGIWVFANAAARDAAVTSPQEGNCCYLKDTDAVQTYSGSAWVGFDDSNAIQNSIVDAKGDIVTATANDTPARLAVGNNGETLVADSSATTGLRYSATPSASNPVLNSAMQVWQRGTSVSIAASTGAGSTTFSADRFQTGTGANQAITISRQATGDTTNLPFIQYALRYQRNSGQTGTGALNLAQNFESVNSIPFAGKVVTLSFYARAGANYSAASSALGVILYSATSTDGNVLTGGFTGAATPISSSATLTTTWQRFTFTSTAIASTTTQLAPVFAFTPVGTASTNDYYEVTGVQIDVGSVALPFRTYAANIQGELAACQRYYVRFGGSSVYETLATGIGQNTLTSVVANVFLPVQMRVAPTSVEYSTVIIYDGASLLSSPTGIALDNSSTKIAKIGITGLTSIVAYRPNWLLTNNSTSGYLGFSAEL